MFYFRQRSLTLLALFLKETCASRPQHEIIQELYETIRTHKTADGRLLCESFIRVPKRRSAADYYDVVTTPIDLLKIQQKVKTDSYDYVDQLSADILLMVNNAKAYYKVRLFSLNFKS